MVGDGLGTALKPATELIAVARKPLSEPTVAANVLRWGTGALNVDACRIGFASTADEQESKGKNKHAEYGTVASNKVYGDYTMVPAKNYTAAGRWPANVVLSHSLFCTDDACDPSCAVALLDAQSGERPGGSRPARRGGIGYHGGNGTNDGQTIRYDSGGASRFYYVAKASRKERRGSSHPTVKPVALMRYLIRLVTPPGGTILDPFAGSGTTGEAALLEGFAAVLIEREAEYVADIYARLGIAHETAAD